MEKKDIVM